MITINVDTGKLAGKINLLREVTKKSLAATLRSEGRLLAVSLAKYTQPFGFDDKARQQGEQKLARDYDKVYVSEETGLAPIVAGYARPKDRAKAKLRFLRYLQSGNFTASEKMLLDMQVKIEYGRTAKPAFHAARWKNGKLYRGPSQAVLNRVSIDRLVKREQRKVGFAKSGWAACARELGGTRGIPQWITRNKAPGRVIIENRNPEIRVTLINEVNYTGRVLSQESKRLALAEREAAITARIDMIVKAEAAKAGAK